MGSHASQLDRNQRWKIIHYVKTLQNPDLVVGSGESADTDTEVIADAGEAEVVVENTEDESTSEENNQH